MSMYKRLVGLILVFSAMFNQYAFSQSNFDDEVVAVVERSHEKGLAAPIIFIGSSSIKKWQTLENDFEGFPVLNHGFGGSEFRDLTKYQDQLVEEFEPSMLVIYAGDNDIANGKTPDLVANHADVFVDGLRRSAGGALAVIISTKPSPARWELKDKYVELNAKLKEVADGLEHVVFVDVWTPMLTRKGEPNAKLFLDDGLHMNEKGYAVWKNALLPYISK